MGRLLRCSLASTTSLISCTRSELLCIGMLEKAWKKASSQRHAKILLPWRRITKRLALRPQRVRERKKDTATSSERGTLSRAMFAARSLQFRETALYHLAAQNCCAVTIIFI